MFTPEVLYWKSPYYKKQSVIQLISKLATRYVCDTMPPGWHGILLAHDMSGSLGG